MEVLLCAEDSESELRSEFLRAFPAAHVQNPYPLLLETDANLLPGERWPHLVFARQWLPNARSVNSESIQGWANALLSAVAGVLPDDQAWSLHIEPHYGTRTTHRIGARAWHSASRLGMESRERFQEHHPPAPDAEAGRHRCKLIREVLLERLHKKRRHLLRHLRPGPAPFCAEDSLVQLLLARPDHGYLSVAPAPLPFHQRHLLSPFPKGDVPPASDKTAPSRAFAKLVEAELRLGRAIRSNEACVDLGASPGSWTYVAISRGASVIAVDRSPLRDDLMRHPLVHFQTGDAFRFQPKRLVDWLLCDVIATPDRSANLLLEWLRKRWCRQFVVTLKLKDTSGEDVLAALKRDLPPLARECFISRLNANKKEVCVFGVAAL